MLIIRIMAGAAISFLLYCIVRIALDTIRVERLFKSGKKIVWNGYTYVEYLEDSK